jgi:hypothetical protein
MIKELVFPEPTLFTTDDDGKSKDALTAEELFEMFETPDELRDCKVLFAQVDQDGYEEAAQVVAVRGQQLFSVFGSHCSCYGFEEQWDEEQETLKTLQKEAEKKNASPAFVAWVNELLKLNA